jgi:hypothetical protein
MPVPQLHSVSPGRYEGDVSLTPTIQAVFTYNIDPDSVDSTSVVLLNLSSDAVVALDTPSVNASTVEVEPASALDTNTSYRVILKDDIENIDGTPTGREYSWTFTTVESSLGQAVLSAPADQSLVDASGSGIAPTFVWNVVSGADHYEIQVSKVPTMTDVYWPTGGPDPSGTTVTPSIAFDVDTQYYWRVRAVAVAVPTATDYGDWSEVWSFYVGTEEAPHFEAQAFVHPEANKFYVTAVAPINGATDQQVASIVIRFNRAVDATYITDTYAAVTRNHASGLPRQDTVTGTWSVSGLEATWTPDSTMLENGTAYLIYNMEWVVTLSRLIQDTDGNRLEDDVTLWFTTQYNPLYLNYLAIRQDLGGLSYDIPNDMINRMIHTASLEVNRMLIPLVTTVPGDSPTHVDYTTVLANVPSTTYPYDVQNYVRAKTEWMILRRKRYEMLRFIDTRRTLGALTVVEADIRLLDEVGKMMKELEAQVVAEEVIIGEWGAGRWVERSAHYLPYPYFWNNMDYGRILNYRRTGEPNPTYGYSTGRNTGFVGRYTGGYYGEIT